MREKHPSVASPVNPKQGLNLQSPDWKLNWRSFTLWDNAQLSHTGLSLSFNPTWRCRYSQAHRLTETHHRNRKYKIFSKNAVFLLNILHLSCFFHKTVLAGNASELLVNIWFFLHGSGSVSHSVDTLLYLATHMNTVHSLQLFDTRTVPDNEVSAMLVLILKP